MSRIRPHFLDAESRRDPIDLAREGTIQHRLARRANALVLLDDGMSPAAVARVLLIDDDTIRAWYRLYQADGVEGLAGLGHEGSACRLDEPQQERLKAWVAATLPRSTRQIGAWINRECGVDYQTRSGLIALMHRLGLVWRKPTPLGRNLDPAKQAGFIRSYETLLNRLEPDEVVLFADAVHPAFGAHSVGCWMPDTAKIAVPQTSGRQRVNIHGAINLETGQTHMRDVLSVDAASTIALLGALQDQYRDKRLIHVFLDNARYHHARLTKAWLAQPGCRIQLHFIPAYCPHLNPIERLWGLMHRKLTHNRCYANLSQFSDTILNLLRQTVPANWRTLCDNMSDIFRIIDPGNFRIIG